MPRCSHHEETNVNNTKWTVACVTGSILVLLLLLAAGRAAVKEMAETAINNAQSRMLKVAKEGGDDAEIYIACGNTSDPITCLVAGEKDHGISITYFRGDNLNRVKFASTIVRIERQPRLKNESIHFVDPFSFK